MAHNFVKTLLGSFLLTMIVPVGCMRARSHFSSETSLVEGRGLQNESSSYTPEHERQQLINMLQDWWPVDKMLCVKTKDLFRRGAFNKRSRSRWWPYDYDRALFCIASYDTHYYWDKTSGKYSPYFDGTGVFMPTNANVYDVREAAQDPEQVFTWAFTPLSTARPEEKSSIYDVLLIRLFNKDSLSREAFPRAAPEAFPRTAPLHHHRQHHQHHQHHQHYQHHDHHQRHHQHQHHGHHHGHEKMRYPMKKWVQNHFVKLEKPQYW